MLDYQCFRVMFIDLYLVLLHQPIKNFLIKMIIVYLVHHLVFTAITAKIF